MKKFIAIVMSLCAAVLMTGCDDVLGPKCVDWAPVTLHIYVSDAEGNNLVDPNYEQNILHGLSITYKGDTYEQVPFTDESDIIDTKTYVPTFLGLFNYADANNVWYVGFGEIDGELDMDEDLTINWPDGSTDVIHYHCSDHRSFYKVKCNRSWKLNGEKHDGSTFCFVR